MSERHALRRHFRAQRRELSSVIQTQHALRVAQTLRASSVLASAQCIGLYMANDGEVDLAPLATELTDGNWRLALPVVGAPTEMEFYYYRPGDELVPNRFHIPEPNASAELVKAAQIDLLLIPVVAFDRAGNRLGMGAGYYDRYLARQHARARPLIIGVAHEVQRSDRPLPTESWDIPMDHVITEAGWQVGD